MLILLNLRYFSYHTQNEYIPCKLIYITCRLKNQGGLSRSRPQQAEDGGFLRLAEMTLLKLENNRVVSILFTAGQLKTETR